MPREGERCPMGNGGECWDCVRVYHEMVPRLATGATYHAMNNCLMGLIGACMTGDRDAYGRERCRFFALAKLGVEMGGRR